MSTYLASTIALFIGVEWKEELSYLLDPLDRITAAYDSLDKPIRDAAKKAAERLDARGYLTLTDSVPATADLRAYLVGHRMQPADSIAWGYEPPRSGTKGVIWVRERRDSLLSCVAPVGRGGDPPAAYFWVDGFGATCDMRRRRVVASSIEDSILALIRRQDGVLSPDEVNIK